MRYLIAVAVVLTSGATQGPRQPVGEIVNPSVEVQQADGRPTQWIMEPRPQPGAPAGAEVASGTSHAGSRSLLVSAPRVSWTNKTLVRPYATYRLSGWIRTEGVPAGLAIMSECSVRRAQGLNDDRGSHSEPVPRERDTSTHFRPRVRVRRHAWLDVQPVHVDLAPAVLPARCRSPTGWSADLGVSCRMSAPVRRLPDID